MHFCVERVVLRITLEKASPFLGLGLLSSYLVKESLILLHHGSERTTPPTNCQGKSQEDLLLIPFQRRQNTTKNADMANEGSRMTLCTLGSP